MLFRSKDKLDDSWMWTSRQNAKYASSAWVFTSYGTTCGFTRSAAGGALAVRLIQLTA